MGLWTRVRLPPIPLDCEVTNPLKGAQIAVLGNVFAIAVDM